MKKNDSKKMGFLNCFTPKGRDGSKPKPDLEEPTRTPDVPPLSKGGTPNGTTKIVDDAAFKPTAELSGFDTAREFEQPPPTVMAQITKPKSKTGGKKVDPAQHFVKELPKHPEYRRQLVELIKAGAEDEGLPGHLVAFINDNGHSVSSLNALTEALYEARTSSLLLWASRYNLFVMWSADRLHPWDSLENAEEVSAVLEIGKAEFEDEVIVLLDGVQVKNWEFKNGVLMTRDAVHWTTPTGDSVLVNLSLKFGTFFGYAKPTQDEEFPDVGSQSYLGTQCHGVMWPAEMDLPHGWPVAPPIVAGKVNIASRNAALSPGATDPISTFSGVYTTHYLPTAEGKNVRAGPELAIASNSNGTSSVSLNGAKVEAWAFSPNNVLSWEDGAGHTAWLLFMSLAGGPVIMGNVLKPDQAPPSGFSIFGELKSQPSRLTPTDHMNAVVGHKVASGLQVASTLLLGEILDITQKLWGGSTSKHPNGVANGRVSTPNPEALLAHKIDTLLQLEDLSDLFSQAFLSPVKGGGLDILNVISPALTKEVESYLKEAESKTEMAKFAASSAEKDARDTEDADKTKNVAVATYKAAQAALRSQESAEAAAEAERLAVEAGEAAIKASTAQALDTSLAAAQAFNQARKEALIAAKAGRRAAAAALSSVEAGIELHARAKNFDKLRETAQASGIATKVLSLASQAVEGWETNTAASRMAALQAAKAAAVDAQDCNKHTRRMQPNQPNSPTEPPVYDVPPTTGGKGPVSGLM